MKSPLGNSPNRGGPRMVLKMAAVDFATMTPEKREGLMRISSHDDKVKSSTKRTKYRNVGQAISS